MKEFSGGRRNEREKFFSSIFTIAQIPIDTSFGRIKIKGMIQMFATCYGC